MINWLYCQIIMDKQKTARQKSRALVFKALAHPSRISIVEALVEREHCVNELTDLLGIDASTPPRHLAILRNAGLVADEKRGACVYYRLQCTCVLTFIECVESIISHRADIDAGVPFEPAPSCRS
jgi:ArsR family transcriptional regulator, arsenate/arsenite/antimonite-responsive transcriptional repressor